MMRFSIVFCVCTVLLGLGGCKEEKVKNACQVDSGADLPWLPQVIAEGRITGGAVEVTRYSYRGEPVYRVDLCAGCADFGSVVYNCRGEEVCRFYGFGGIEGAGPCLDFSEAVEEKVIWRE
jgi:hypothetical protein